MDDAEPGSDQADRPGRAEPDVPLDGRTDPAELFHGGRHGDHVEAIGVAHQRPQAGGVGVEGEPAAAAGRTHAPVPAPLGRGGGGALRLGPPAGGMEFASEMIVKAALARWSIAEVPRVLSPAGRSRPPHLRSWRDGWRHLRFLLIMSPRWLLLYPGVLLIAAGLAVELAILRGPVVIHGVGFDIQTMLYAAGATILGLQLVLFSVIGRTVGVLKRLLPITPRLRWFLRVFTVERGVLLGISLGLAGLGLAVYSLDAWVRARLGAMDPVTAMRVVITSVTMMLAGGEILFASFLLGLIDVRPGEGIGR